LNGSKTYAGLSRPTSFVPLSHNLDFIKGYPVKSIAELKSNPELGTFIVNGRMGDIVGLDAWWYPTCECGKIFEEYIGSFHCDKCHIRDFKPTPKLVFAYIDFYFFHINIRCYLLILWNIVLLDIYFVLIRVKLTIEVEDETGQDVFKVFDHVMADIADVDRLLKVRKI
jgi:hypothetical protein